MSGVFADRVAIVTGAGAAGGIGAAIAAKLVSEGARVVLGATSDRIHQRAEELGDSAVGVVADLTVDGAADTLVTAAWKNGAPRRSGQQRGHDLGVLRGGFRQRVVDLTLDDWNTAIARNLNTAFLMCRAAVPVMKKAGYGRIVSIGSTTGVVNAMPGRPPTRRPRRRSSA